MTDLELLRHYEPVVRFTEGELFFPCAVDRYVKRCSLRLRLRAIDEPEVIPAGQLDLDVLSREGATDSARALCMQLVQEPLKGLAYQRWLTRPGRPEFHTAGRLARVGLTARFVNSLFSLSLLLRGTVPGGTAAVAEQQYCESFAESPGYVYYGRVLRQGHYIVLTYLFFYFMNDWRSTFAGVNDHEADWEQVFVFLADGAGSDPEPAWVAYASHDYQGDDLRRRWNDPELTIRGTHPVVFAGAGSHSSYFLAGEYLTSVRIRYLDPIFEAIQVGRRFWRDVLRQGEPDRIVRRLESLLRIPFVDYARGDGRAIGPGQANEWQPVLITEETSWVHSYRGLWGLDTHDPWHAESAPSGPMYQRDGSLRQTWYDPVGWCGLEKVAPAWAAIEVLDRDICELEKELVETAGTLDQLSQTLPQLDLQVRALREVEHLRATHRAREAELETQEQTYSELQRRRVELTEILAACRLYRTRLQSGDLGDPQAHIREKRSPQTNDELRESRFAEIWAGISVSLLLLGGVLVALTDRQNWITTLVLFITTVIFIENILRRTITRLLLNATIFLATLSTAALVYRFFWQLGITAIVVIALVILRDNLREIREL